MNPRLGSWDGDGDENWDRSFTVQKIRNKENRRLGDTLSWFFFLGDSPTDRQTDRQATAVESYIGSDATVRLLSSGRVDSIAVGLTL